MQVLAKREMTGNEDITSAVDPGPNSARGAVHSSSFSFSCVHVRLCVTCRDSEEKIWLVGNLGESYVVVLEGDTPPHYLARGIHVRW